MSAFEVSNKHINHIINGWIQTDEPIYIENDTVSVHNFTNIEMVGQILMDGNCESVNYRYGEESEPNRYKFTSIEEKLKPIEILKLISCLEYQSCEVDDYDKTFSSKICKQITDRLIMQLPGYEEAEWTI